MCTFACTQKLGTCRPGKASASKYISESEVSSICPPLPREPPRLGTEHTEGNQVGLWILMGEVAVRAWSSSDFFSDGGNQWKGLREKGVLGLFGEQAWVISEVSKLIQVWRKGKGVLCYPQTLFGLVLSTGPFCSQRLETPWEDLMVWAASRIFTRSKYIKKGIVYSWASQLVLVVKNLPANGGDRRGMDFIPGLGRGHAIPGRGHGDPLQYSCLENPMDRVAWWAIVQRVAEVDVTEATQHTCIVNNIFSNTLRKID